MGEDMTVLTNRAAYRSTGLARSLEPSLLSRLPQRGTPARVTVEIDRPERFAWLEATLVRVDELMSLGKNWDSYGAYPVSGDAAASLLSLLLPLLPEAAEPPFLVPTPTGGIQASWDGYGHEVEVVIESGQDVSVYYAHEGAEEEFYLGSSEAMSRLVQALGTTTAA